MHSSLCHPFVVTRMVWKTFILWFVHKASCLWLDKNQPLGSTSETTLNLKKGLWSSVYGTSQVESVYWSNNENLDIFNNNRKLADALNRTWTCLGKTRFLVIPILRFHTKHPAVSAPVAKCLGIFDVVMWWYGQKIWLRTNYLIFAAWPKTSVLFRQVGRWGSKISNLTGLRFSASHIQQEFLSRHTEGFPKINNNKKTFYW